MTFPPKLQLLFPLLILSCARAPESTQRTTPPDSPAPAASAASSPDSTLLDLADRSRIEGEEAAPVWIIDASDFQCPYCAEWHRNTHAALRAEYVRTGKAKVAFVNYPLPQHRHAMVAAEAAMCAGVQGRFWPVHDGLFESQTRWAEVADPLPIFESIAGRAGVSVARWGECMRAHSTRPLIESDRERASRSGVNSTPTFIVGGQLVRGSAPIEEFRRLIDAALAPRP